MTKSKGRRLLLAATLLLLLVATATAQMRTQVGMAVDTAPVGTADFQTLSLTAYQLEDRSGVYINSMAVNPVARVAKVVMYANAVSVLAICLPDRVASQESVICKVSWPRASMRVGLNELAIWATLGNGVVVKGSTVRIERPAP